MDRLIDANICGMCWRRKYCPYCGVDLRALDKKICHIRVGLHVEMMEIFNKNKGAVPVITTNEQREEVSQDAPKVIVTPGRVAGLSYLVALGPGSRYVRHRPPEYYEDQGERVRHSQIPEELKRVYTRLMATNDGQWHTLLKEEYWLNYHVKALRSRIRNWCYRNQHKYETKLLMDKKTLMYRVWPVSEGDTKPEV